jgi:uncharacterized protein (TIGR02646 family)
MIFIDKSIVATPEDLSTETHTQANREQYDSNSATFALTLHNTYKTPKVKLALRKTQGADENGIGGKCAYCEKDLREEAAHVDHFRPAGAIMEGITKIHPGYYWLAYTWENLYLSCLACNSSFKRDFFPLIDPAKRARSHHDEISNEEPLLIDPSKENPRDHIRFNLDMPEPYLNSEKGKITIEIFKLDNEKKRLNLIKARLKFLNILRSFRRVIEFSIVAPEEIEEYKQFLIESIQPSSEYSSMAKDYLDEFLDLL